MTAEKTEATTKASNTEQRDILRIPATNFSKLNRTINYVVNLFKDKKIVEIIAAGKAIPNAIIVIELTKQKVEGLHQMITIGSREHKADNKTIPVATINILLSTDPSLLDTTQPGYKAPLKNVDNKQSQRINENSVM